ncbi:hypothetical protein ACA910_001811 [Epithemia clementina (nom. ined.)]
MSFCFDTLNLFSMRFKDKNAERELIEFIFENKSDVSNEEKQVFNADKHHSNHCWTKGATKTAKVGKGYSVRELTVIQKDLNVLIEATTERTKVLKSHLKESQIQFALQWFGQVKSFDYYTTSCRAPHKILGSSNSSFLVLSILWCFRQENGFPLPKNGFLLVQGEKGEERDYSGFRERVVNQLHQLLGSRPRLQEESDGSYSIWYE